jgi:hypothetical protein
VASVGIPCGGAESTGVVACWWPAASGRWPTGVEQQAAGVGQATHGGAGHRRQVAGKAQGSLQSSCQRRAMGSLRVGSSRRGLATGGVALVLEFPASGRPPSRSVESGFGCLLTG